MDRGASGGAPAVRAGPGQPSWSLLSSRRLLRPPSYCQAAFCRRLIPVGFAFQLAHERRAGEGRAPKFARDKATLNLGPGLRRGDGLSANQTNAR